MIEMIHTLVTEFAMHGMFCHGNIADPTVFHGFIRRTRIRLSLFIVVQVQSGKPRAGSTVDGDRVLSDGLPVLPQVYIERIRGDGPHTKMYHERHDTQKYQCDGTRRAFG